MMKKGNITGPQLLAAAVVVIVFIVILIAVIGPAVKMSSSAFKCSTQGGSCEPSCGEGYTVVSGAECDDGKVCCRKINTGKEEKAEEPEFYGAADEQEPEFYA